MCNRIWSFAGIIAHAIVFKEKVFILDFGIYLDLFPHIKLEKNVHFVKSKLKRYLLYLLAYTFKRLKLIKSYKSDNRTKGLAFINGWHFRHDYMNLERVHNKIHELFLPQSSVVAQCITLFNKERKDTDIIIGIHLRRGDYINWRNGIHYYDDVVIRKYLLQIQSLFKNKAIKFFFASNEKIDLTNYMDFKCFFSDNTSSVADLFSLSLCDYIIGPPSSFSQWASFYGGKPIHILGTSDEILNLNDFEVIKAANTFRSGRKWEHINYVI